MQAEFEDLAVLLDVQKVDLLIMQDKKNIEHIDDAHLENARGQGVTAVVGLI